MDRRFTDVVAEAMGNKQLRLVETAGDYHATERQQWDSANNAVALEPGVVFTYDRTQTNAALRNAGSRSSRSSAPSSVAAAAAGTA